MSFRTTCALRAVIHMLNPIFWARWTFTNVEKMFYTTGCTWKWAIRMCCLIFWTIVTCFSGGIIKCSGITSRSLALGCIIRMGNMTCWTILTLLSSCIKEWCNITCLAFWYVFSSFLISWTSGTSLTFKYIFFSSSTIYTLCCICCMHYLISRTISACFIC